MRPGVIEGSFPIYQYSMNFEIVSGVNDTLIHGTIAENNSRCLQQGKNIGFYIRRSQSVLITSKAETNKNGFKAFQKLLSINTDMKLFVQIKVG